MIISLGTEQAFDKIQPPFMRKVLERLGIQETNLNMINTIQQDNSQHQITWIKTQNSQMIFQKWCQEHKMSLMQLHQ